jgi:hypothetical protein
MLVIEPQDIEAVLLNDGWHIVHGKSFRVVQSEISTTGMWHAEWKNAATWQELATGATQGLRSVATPFDHVLAIRKAGEPYTP